MSTRRPAGASILRELMDLQSNWAAGRFPLRAFAEQAEEHGDEPVTAIVLGARFSAALLGPYVEELLTILRSEAEGHPDVDSTTGFAVGDLVCDTAIQRKHQENSGFSDELDRPAINRLVEMLRFFEWTSTAESGPQQILIPSPGHYAALQQAFALNRFRQVESSPFPRAVLDKGGAKGFAEMRPHHPTNDLSLAPEEIDALAQRMWAQREELSDRDADTMDAISAAWIREARTPSDRIPIYIDDLLRQRGLKAKKSGKGSRGGFEPEQRQALWTSLLRLQDIWLDLAEVTLVEEDKNHRRRRRTRTLQSRAFVMTDRVGQRRIDGTMDVEAILVTPGEAFGRFLLGPGRQLALLSSRALRYDPMRRRLEKRLARYLAWQWRAGAKSGNFIRTYRVKTLGKEIGIDLYRPRNPSRTRDRLEKALALLQADGVLAAWQYQQPWDEETLPREGWFSIWLDARLGIEAPDVIKNSYRKLDQIPSPLVALKGASWAARLKHQRKKLGLSQMVVAEELGISQGYVAQIERGRQPSRKLRKKLELWLID